MTFYYKVLVLLLTVLISLGVMLLADAPQYTGKRRSKGRLMSQSQTSPFAIDSCCAHV
jgi:hypothetical protein